MPFFCRLKVVHLPQYVHVQNLMKKKWILVLGRVSNIFLTNFLKDFQSSPPLDFRSSPPLDFRSSPLDFQAKNPGGGWIPRDSVQVCPGDSAPAGAESVGQLNILHKVNVLIYFQNLSNDWSYSVESIVISKLFLTVTNARNLVLSF